MFIARTINATNIFSRVATQITVTELHPLPTFTRVTATTKSPKPNPTATPSPTPSITEAPTDTPYPTATSTFDAYHQTIATRSPVEVCPERNPDLKPPDFESMFVPPYDQHFQQYYLDYFNSGGIASALPAYWRPDYTIDLTNDGVPEYVLKISDVFILGCRSGQYRLLLDARTDAGNGANEIYDIEDANLNGIPEIILRVKLTPLIEIKNVIAWDGTQFKSLLVPNDRHVNQDGMVEDLKSRIDLKFAAMDKDPLLELAAYIHPPYFDSSYDDGYPWRNEVDYYKWNGSSYVFIKQVYDPPYFRFQAVHDGDWAFLRGEYDQAIKFYVQAIKDDNLYWYSEARRNYLLATDPKTSLQYGTPVKPTYDPNEYPNLAAYSYFRMMLADIKQDHIGRAQTVYDWLQTNFLADSPGHVYAELAAIYWSEYQKSQDLGQSCAATYDYASSHPEEIFRYITTHIVINKKLITWPNPINFGSQSSELEYSPAMICPSK